MRVKNFKNLFSFFFISCVFHRENSINLFYNRFDSYKFRSPVNKFNDLLYFFWFFNHFKKTSNNRSNLNFPSFYREIILWRKVTNDALAMLVIINDTGVINTGSHHIRFG